MSTARVQEYLGNIPLVTKALLALNVGVHILLFLTSFPIHLLAINPQFVLSRGEYYRLISSAFVHGGVLHILMNMSSLIAMGTMLENSYGSMRMLILTLWAVVLCGCTFVALVW
jgi:membrane associated rhomboid family serine protease